MQEQLQAFLMDKANVVMSSYKTDITTNEPVHYLKQTKTALWKKYHEQYPDGVQRTTFFTKLEGNKYIYHENLAHCENLKRFLKCDYKQHFHVTSNGIAFHDLCINHCLLYAFNQCTESHTFTCNKCQEFFNFFADIETHSNETNYNDLQDMKEHLLYYLTHQTRKVPNLMPISSSLHAILETLDSQPESVIIMSDNGSHYHNADLMMIMAFCWPKWYNVKVKNGHRLTPHTEEKKKEEAEIVKDINFEFIRILGKIESGNY
ncbi:hypothetical protein GLOIN_2v1767687 [Rhizophagus irregularis DAOM 181602=DAOM 197198]|nr:hypothetical protein GLOIN_2v1767687 [Rhizophagus irregularis DAOM 181602=DAOM 197198]